MSKRTRANRFIYLSLRDRGYTDPSDIFRILALWGYIGYNDPLDTLIERGFLMESAYGDGKIAITERARKYLKRTEPR